MQGEVTPGRRVTIARPLLVAVAVGLAILAGSWAVYRKTRRDESDRQAIVLHILEMERALRAHDARMWLHVTTTHPVAPGDAAHAAAHEAMLRDFERLQHLEGLELSDIQVEIDGDTAVARYRILFSRAADAARVPKLGELHFVRGSEWQMTSHRLLDR